MPEELLVEWFNSDKVVVIVLADMEFAIVIVYMIVVLIIVYMEFVIVVVYMIVLVMEFEFEFYLLDMNLL